MPAVEIDEEIWALLKTNAEPFADSPNDVLRRMLGLSKPCNTNVEQSSFRMLIRKPSDSMQSRKLRGAESRDVYLEYLKAKGITLEPIKGTSFLSRSGLVVIIPSATMTRENYWWLGTSRALLSGEPGKVLVLLCTRKDEFLDFVFSPWHVNRLISVIGADQNDQLKFNIKQVGTRYHLLLPDKDPEDVTARMSDYSVLGEMCTSPATSECDAIPSNAASVPLKQAKRSDRKVRNIELERSAKRALAIQFQSDRKWGRFFFEEEGCAVFPEVQKKLICKYSTYDEQNDRWFWGVKEKHWRNWGHQDHLALIWKDRHSDSHYFTLLDPSEAQSLLMKCGESKGDNKKNINMRKYADGAIRFQEMQDFSVLAHSNKLTVDTLE